MDDIPTDLDASVSPEPKNSRRVLTLSTKMEILQQLESGESASSLGRAYSVNESTIRTIRTKADVVKRSVQNSSETSMKYCRRVRDPSIEKMENMLSVWIEDNNQNSVPQTATSIRNKALKIYQYLKREQGEEIKPLAFQASKTWFEKFKKRQLLTNTTFSEEEVSVDSKSAAAFIEDLLFIITSEGYSPQQVFNMTEMELFWKRLPSRTFISTEEKTAYGFKARKDSLTLMLSSNASGDHKCTPLVLYHSQMPRALKNVHTLPLHWRANQKGWMSSTLVEEWLTDCFAPEVKKYCTENSIPFNILLILDTSPCHLPQLNSLNPNIQVVLLPPCTATILQPLDNGVTDNFKLCYVLHILKQLHAEFKELDKDSVRQFWKKFNIRHSTEMIMRAWDSISDRVINMSWKVLWKECVMDSKGSDECQSDYIDEIVRLGKKAKFSVFDESDVKELIESNKIDMQEDELDYLLKSNTESTDTHNIVVKSEDIYYEELGEFMKKVNSLIQMAIDIDSNIERSVGVKRKINEAAFEYQKMYLNKGKKKVKGNL